MKRRGTLRTVSPDFAPPHDLRAERSVLGAVFVNPRILGEVSEIVTDEHFYDETHRVVFRAALALGERGAPVDQVTIADELGRLDEFDEAGARRLVFELVESVPVAANATRYAKIVYDKAMLRNLIDAGSRIVDDALRQPEDVAQALDEAEQMVYEIAQDGLSKSAGQNGAARMEQLAEAALDEIQRRYEHGITPGVSTGFADLDRITLGSQDGELIILAARPAMGKTAMALSLVEAASRQDDSAALVFSLEMSKEQLTNRMISHASSIPVTSITDPSRLASSEWQHLVGAVGNVGQMPILIDDDAQQTVTRMRNRIRREVSRLKNEGKRLNLIAVDYLQLMVGDRSRNADSRQYEVGDISRGLKVIARDFGVPVIALSQLSRACEQRQDKRPMLSDLRDSGAIEQDADKVMFLYRDEYYEADTEDRGVAEVIVAKHRNGPTGTVKLAWIERFAQFASLARSDS